MPPVQVSMFDGAALVNMLKPGASKTFANYSDEVFLTYIKGQLRSVQRIDAEYAEIILTKDRLYTCTAQSAQKEQCFARNLEDICTEDIDRFQFVPFGGPNEHCLVQCDESKFNNKAKVLMPPKKRARRGTRPAIHTDLIERSHSVGDGNSVENPPRTNTITLDVQALSATISVAVSQAVQKAIAESQSSVSNTTHASPTEERTVDRVIQDEVSRITTEAISFDYDFKPRVSNAISPRPVRKRRFPIGEYARQKKIARVEIATERVKADKTVAKLTEKLKYRNKKGLDYIAADGAEAFDDLGEIVTKLSAHGCDSEWTAYCERALKSGKQYVKSDYKVHVAESDSVGDHCCNYALSDPNEELFRSTCDHQHDRSCSSCEELKAVLSSIANAVDKAAGKVENIEGDDLQFSCKHAIQAIDNWKSHQLRSLRQDKSRTDIISSLNDSNVLITQDWAMKFLPQKYRESQSDWFGKRGISWHVSVVVRRSKAGNLQHQAFIHIAKNCNQDSNAVVAIMGHTLRHLKNEHPEITEAMYRQDNAGCYHGATMLTACHSMKDITGIEVKRVDFSDPQGGKGPCDRKAATVKGHVRRYINEGNDVLTAVDFKDAILSYTGVRGVRVCLVDMVMAKVSQPMKIDGVSTLNNFGYTDEKLTMWKAYDIGEGKSITWSEQQG
ncbi:hypothetical protein QZH41_003631 [Actinostola sp. cb2023]|nr:hypothetical protein QZH41_003631 [Actinostola sp. cb2023]